MSGLVSDSQELTPNKPAPNPATAPRADVGALWRRVGDPGRWATPMNQLIIHTYTFASLLLATLCMCAGQSRAAAPQQHTNGIPDVISMPVGFAGWPMLTSNEVASLQLRLSQAHIESRTNLEAVLLQGSKLMPISHALCSPLDRDGKGHPYTETVSVCRLNVQKDLVVVEDNRSGTDVVRRCFIRDVPSGKGGPQK